MKAERDVSGLTGDPVAAAIRRACAGLIRLQHPDGYWCGELLVDITLCADTVIYLHWADEVDPVLEAKCIEHIERRQLADGGWGLTPEGPSEVNASVKGYVALKLAGHSPDSDPMERARAAILRMGGIPKMNTYGKFYLALLGQFPWEALPVIPPEIVLFPHWFPLSLYRLSAWTRVIVVPMAIISHFRPTRVLPPEKQLHELYPAGISAADLRQKSERKPLSWRNFFLLLNRVARVFEALPLAPLRRKALRAAERWMRDRTGPGSDGLGAVFPSMLNYLIALRVLGVPEESQTFRKAKADFEGLFVDDPGDFRIQPCLSPIWDTAINIVALIQAGMAPDEPAVTRAARWLVEREVSCPEGDWRRSVPGVMPSGWAFEFRNEYYPDTDDTAMVLMALSLADYGAGGEIPDDSKHDRLFDRALAWLGAFQNRDGGWGAFDKNIDMACLEQVPFADHNAILDPSCADLTGRTLELLGGLGKRRNSPVVRRAVDYLRSTQEPDGSWSGRWGVNYLYGTWQVLRGLREIGIDFREDWLVRARNWVESCQNEDGGWGESCHSYEDPSLKGKGPSTASQTAWAVMALCACGDPDRPSVIRGIGHLVRTQRPDGTWEDELVTGTGFPRVFYLRYDMYRNNWPLLALTAYARLRSGVPPPKRFYRIPMAPKEL
jgi:squalene-hopene/tetraprenyl-beta-curcumene cyclase